MNILIVGYGRMGREVEKILLERGHTVVARVDQNPGVGDTTEITSEVLRSTDAVIEFSLPEGLVENISRYAKAGVPAVIGTTGWEAQREQVATMIKQYNSGLVYGTNFSLGAHMFFHLVEKAAAMIADFPEYDIMVTEYHHKLKKDSPSGTALTTAERILRNNPRKTVINADRINRQIRDEELHVASVRGGSIPGIHSVLLDSLADTVEIRHTARSRVGFALGSVLAAEWIIGKTGFFEVEEFARDFLAKALKK